MLSRAKQIIKLVFSSQPDLSTPAGRSQDRYRRAARTSAAAILTRCVSITANFIVVPLTLGYLGEESFGMWMALTSFMLFLTFTDMGLGVGLQNALADCNGRDDKQAPRYYISSGLFVMTLLFLLFVALAIFVLPHIDLRRLITVRSDETAAQLLPTARAILITFGFGLPAGMIQRIYNAYQRGYWGYLQIASGSLLGLIGVLLCIYYRLGLPTLAFVFMGMRFFVPLGGSVFLFWKQQWLRPAFSAIRKQYARCIFSTGITAMGSQFAAMIILSGLPLIIAKCFGVSAVTPLSLSQKLLGVATMVLTMSIWSLWPAYSESAARGDWGWIRRTFRRTVKVSLAVIVPTFLIASLAGQWIIELWTGKKEVVPIWSLLMAWNIWTLFRAWSVACSILLNGLNRMLGQALYGITFGFVGLAAAYVFAPNVGLANSVWIAVVVGEGLRAVCMGIEVALVIRRQQ